MLFVRNKAVKFLLILLLLCACAPQKVVVDSKAAIPPAPSPIPSPTTIVPPPTAEATREIFQGPLSVVIQSPLDNAVVQVSPVEILGEADPDTVITFNETTILVDQQRIFRVLFALEPGENLIEITASDIEGNQGFAYLTLLYEP